ncbi:MAG: bifunctional 4-hydroxy-2-oxoglutarate aldolase/2-dehydro-3-deoxy-phosphogluconate aldolase [Alphaproteobacteria bacterium]|nr:bifunctional 4-hydroxy-2-oxoglutarate aldolase/2-dehydro-3-deoxy-phosphogluconate aldolase [Alphaproteobacteria bacterium]
MVRDAGLLAILKSVPVIPVLTVNGPDDAVPLARALVEGGLSVLEVTLRTEGALKAIEAIKHAVPDAILGAGTVLSLSQVEEARSAGSSFLVSPGSTVKLAEAAAHQGIPLLPGVATASEAMAMAEMGHHLLKFFPAEPAGGVAYLKSLSAPLPHLMFCPYLALSNVICVGGSWVTPADAVKAGDWARITALAKDCALLR